MKNSFVSITILLSGSRLSAALPATATHVTSLSVFLVSQQEPGLTNGTLAEISSPASASLLLNRLQLDDDPEADAQDPYGSAEPRDLLVTVDDPKKHVSTMETYITYRVSTKVSARLTTRLTWFSIKEDVLEHPDPYFLPSESCTL